MNDIVLVGVSQSLSQLHYQLGRSQRLVVLAGNALLQRLRTDLDIDALDPSVVPGVIGPAPAV